MKTSQHINIIEYDEKYAFDTVKMWRASIEKALGVTDPHSWEEQLEYLKAIVTANRVYLGIEEPTDKVVAMMAVGGSELDHLYVHVDYQGLGIGTRLLNVAKELSPGRLQLYTFEINKMAQLFYERHGFVIIGRGVESQSGMADIRYEWVKDRPTGNTKEGA
jgi:ribosomal protein S18 acetylase RimI-like enzyme